MCFSGRSQPAVWYFSPHRLGNLSASNLFASGEYWGDGIFFTHYARAFVSVKEHVHLSHTDHTIGASRRMLQTLQTTMAKILRYLLDVWVPIRTPYPWYGRKAVRALDITNRPPIWLYWCIEVPRERPSFHKVCRTKCVPDLRTKPQGNEGLAILPISWRFTSSPSKRVERWHVRRTTADSALLQYKTT